MYSESIMKALRQRRGLESDDITEDEKILKLSKEIIFDEYCKWHGLMDWSCDLLKTIENIYDINLT